MRIRRRRCSLPSSAAIFSACCREHGPRERTGAVTIGLLFDSLGTYLAKSIFSVMLAVCSALSSCRLKYRIFPYNLSGTQTPALLAIYPSTRLQRCATSHAPPFQASSAPPVSDVMEGAGGRYPGPPATLAPAI